MAQAAPYDLVIVGGGTAGCILAARIAQHGIRPGSGEKLRVALLEAGPYFPGRGRPGHGIRLRRCTFTNLTRDNPRFAMRGGSRILGGSSVSFGGQSHIPFGADYRNWTDTTGVDWTEEKLGPAAAEVRRIFNLHPDPDEALSAGQARFRQVARLLGYEVRRYEGAKQNCLHCGYCFTGHMCKYDSKMSTLLTH